VFGAARALLAHALRRLAGRVAPVLGDISLTELFALSRRLKRRNMIGQRHGTEAAGTIHDFFDSLLF
jgi:hypothetical protein